MYEQNHVNFAYSRDIINNNNNILCSSIFSEGLSAESVCVQLRCGNAQGAWSVHVRTLDVGHRCCLVNYSSHIGFVSLLCRSLLVEKVSRCSLRNSSIKSTAFTNGLNEQSPREVCLCCPGTYRFYGGGLSFINALRRLIMQTNEIICRAHQLVLRNGVARCVCGCVCVCVWTTCQKSFIYFAFQKGAASSATLLLHGSAQNTV